jgi:hypothetical protein
MTTKTWGYITVVGFFVVLALIVWALFGLVHPKAEASYVQISCNSYHSVCQESACVRVQGVGENACTSSEDCITPTITPEVTPEVTPTVVPEAPCSGNCGSPPTFSGSSTDAPKSTVCTVPIAPPILTGFKELSKTSVLWSWWASVTPGIEHQWLTYGYKKDDRPYSVLDIPAGRTSQETGLLQVGLMRWAQVCAIKDGCVACSEPLDP